MHALAKENGVCANFRACVVVYARTPMLVWRRQATPDYTDVRYAPKVLNFSAFHYNCVPDN